MNNVCTKASSWFKSWWPPALRREIVNANSHRVRELERVTAQHDEALKLNEKCIQKLEHVVKTDWRKNEDTYILSLAISARELQSFYVPDERRWVAEHIGRKVEREIMQSRFVQR